MRPSLLVIVTAGATAVTPAFPAQTPAVVVTYRAATEDDASSGRVRLTLAAGRTARAVVWETACAVSSRIGADTPAVESDQFWVFRVDLAKDSAGKPAARVRYRVMKPNRPAKEAPKDEERIVRLDGRDALVLDAFSARTDCRYDRIHLSVSGG